MGIGSNLLLGLRDSTQLSAWCWGPSPLQHLVGPLLGFSVSVFNAQAGLKLMPMFLHQLPEALLGQSLSPDPACSSLLEE